MAGASEADREETLDGLLRAFAIGTPLALLLATGFGYVLAGRGLAPVDAMRRRAEEITLARTGERLPLPAAEDEIHHLGETLNAMLDRIERSLDRERVFVADASHELRTPLAILRTELELAERPGRSTDEVCAALRSAAEEVDRLARLAEDLLVIARSDQGQISLAAVQVDLRELLEGVGGRFARTAADAGRALVVDAPAHARAGVDRPRFEQAVGNLVDNALRHGAGEVRLAGRLEAGRVVVEVSDEGEGFPAGFESEAFERFARARGRTASGTGLGLAIARAIASAHSGSRRHRRRSATHHRPDHRSALTAVSSASSNLIRAMAVPPRQGGGMNRTQKLLLVGGAVAAIGASGTAVATGAVGGGGDDGNAAGDWPGHRKGKGRRAQDHGRRGQRGRA